MAEKQTTADGATHVSDRTPVVDTAPASNPIPSQPPSGTVAISLAPEQWKQICNSFAWAQIAIAEQQPDLYTRVVTPLGGEPVDIHAGGKKIRQDQNKAAADARAEAQAKADARNQ